MKTEDSEINNIKYKFSEVKYGNHKSVLLLTNDGYPLVKTWENEEDLNNTKYFKENNFGNLQINGHYNKFEFLYKNKWLKCDKLMEVSFLDIDDKFLEVRLSNYKDILLENKNGKVLVVTWYDDFKDLNDFKYFKEKNIGHFFINGDINKFEFLYKNKWLKCDDEMPVRFLK